MKNLILSFSFIFFPLMFFGQQLTEITGKIIDADNSIPIPGANVIEKGTSNGVMTDFDGRFSISTPSNATLEISFIGYATKEIQVDGQTQLEISLETQASALDEVVVVAYGTQKKETVTSSVVEVDSEKLTDVTTPEVATMLQGKVTGVQVLPSTGAPGSSPNIIIRGRSSINSTNSPLWVVDGVIIGNSDPKLNPNDVASISVLKDASATALYGNRGANGVIIITTKRGEIGGKPQVRVSIKTAINQFKQGHINQQSHSLMGI